MALVIDPEAAAYGFFQIAFATMDTRLSRSLVAVCQCKSANFALASISRMPFGLRLAQLRKAIKAVESDLPNDSDIQELKTGCDLAESVQRWRNSRIHADVRFAGPCPVLVDRDGKPLQIDREECEQKIREAIRAGIAMEAHVRPLVAFLQDIEALEDSDTY